MTSCLHVMCKATLQVAAPGAESAVSDALLPVSRETGVPPDFAPVQFSLRKSKRERELLVFVLRRKPEQKLRRSRKLKRNKNYNLVEGKQTKTTIILAMRSVSKIR